MTEHEKTANELIELFDEHLNNIPMGSNGLEDQLKILAIGCAILHVEGMIKELNENGIEIDFLALKIRVRFWNQVLLTLKGK